MSFQVSQQKAFPPTSSSKYFFCGCFLNLPQCFHIPLKMLTSGLDEFFQHQLDQWPMLYTRIYLVTHTYYYLWHLCSSTVMGTLIQLPILYDPWSVTYFQAKILCSVSMALNPCSLMNNCAFSCVRMDVVESARLTTLYCTTYHHLTLCWSLCYQQTLPRDNFMLTSRPLMNIHI